MPPTSHCTANNRLASFFGYYDNYRYIPRRLGLLPPAHLQLLRALHSAYFITHLAHNARQQGITVIMEPSMKDSFGKTGLKQREVGGSG